MGVCWSNRIKAESPLHSGSKIVGKDRKDLSRSNSKISCGQQTPRSEGEILQSSNLKSFSFSELKTATRNFRPDSVLGEGGFGAVFKGWIDEHSLTPSRPGTGMVIAVKRLNQEGPQGHKEWLTEINYLGQLRHPHLVRLIGYCLEDEHRLLVYEFMPRGSMENHLFRRSSHFQPLSWSLRMKVALGAARGLAFLHSDKARVIYRDFKTSNILLDVHYNAKLSDFGLARDGPSGDKSYVSTRVMGTHGYAAPEYVATGMTFMDNNFDTSNLKHEFCSVYDDDSNNLNVGLFRVFLDVIILLASELMVVTREHGTWIRAMMDQKIAINFSKFQQFMKIEKPLLIVC